jgi:hypothetical protein
MCISVLKNLGRSFQIHRRVKEISQSRLFSVVIGFKQIHISPEEKVGRKEVGFIFSFYYYRCWVAETARGEVKKAKLS